MQIDRRTLLKGIGAAGATLTFTGFASATDGQARYLVAANGNGVKQRLEREGFHVMAVIAGGRIMIVKGDEDAEEELGLMNGVTLAKRDIAFRMDGPHLAGDDDFAIAGDDADPVDIVYEQYLWDKQVQQVREAHEYATGEGTTVAVLDTGIDHTHPDLDVNVEKSAKIEDVQVKDHAGDHHGHGTHVAGTVAGTGDVGMLGTAPDAELVNVQVLGADGGGTWGDILLGIDYAVRVGADAANMSLGSAPLRGADNAEGYRQMMEPVVQHAAREGTLVVGSAGNDAANLQQGGTFSVPNSLAGVMSVSATGPHDGRAFYSNYGTNEVDVGAPGGGYGTQEESIDPEADVEWPYPLNLVYSTFPGGQYTWMAGTSMAAPQVSGLVALVRELDPSANANQVENAVKHGAEGSNGNSDRDLGAGRVNALRTVKRL